MDELIISADNHLIEAPDTFTSRLTGEYLDRAPRILPGHDGGEGWSFDGRPPRNTFGLNAVAGRSFQDYVSHGLRFDEILPGCYDGAAHLNDMASDGVDAAVLYPNSEGAALAYELDDRPFALAIIRAYNDWLLDEFCSVAPNRLIGLPMMPVDDGISALLAELDHVVDKGARGVFLPYSPRTPYHDPFFDPFWTAVCVRGISVSTHRTLGGKPAASATTPRPEDAAGLNMSGIVERFFAAVSLFGRLVYTGLFERFPTLRLVAAEVNAGWLPFWLQMMEQQYERQRHWARPPLQTSPREFVGRNLFVTVLDDHVGFAAVRADDAVAAATMFSTDYPHSTTLYPRTKGYVAQLASGMDPERRHTVLAGNATRVFGLEVR